MKIFIISREVNKDKYGSAEMNKFQVRHDWATELNWTELIQSMTKKGRYLIQLGKKSALLNRAGNQLRTVPYPV